MIDYNGRQFRPVVAEPDAEPVGEPHAEPDAEPNGEEGRVATYRQDGDLLWGEFRGGRARHGTLTGTCAPDGGLTFAYCMVTEDGEIISGRCASTPQVLDDGRIRLDEVWERYGPHAARGVSSLEEIR